MTSPPPSPSPPFACVADASVLFDLNNGCVIERLPLLPYRFVMPDAVFGELEPGFQAQLQRLGFEVGVLQPRSVLRVYALRPQYPRLSVPDLFAFFLAQDLGAMLLTGDARLRTLGTSQGLIVHGTLWVLDELVARQALATQEALAALEMILLFGARLPARACQERRARWQ